MPTQLILDILFKFLGNIVGNTVMPKIIQNHLVESLILAKLASSAALQHEAIMILCIKKNCIMAIGHCIIRMD